MTLTGQRPKPVFTQFLIVDMNMKNPVILKARRNMAMRPSFVRSLYKGNNFRGSIMTGEKPDDRNGLSGVIRRVNAVGWPSNARGRSSDGFFSGKKWRWIRIKKTSPNFYGLIFVVELLDLTRAIQQPVTAFAATVRDYITALRKEEGFERSWRLLRIMRPSVRVFTRRKDQSKKNIKSSQAYFIGGETPLDQSKTSIFMDSSLRSKSSDAYFNGGEMPSDQDKTLIFMDCSLRCVKLSEEKHWRIRIKLRPIFMDRSSP